LFSLSIWVFNQSPYRDKKVVGVFLAFFVPLHLCRRGLPRLQSEAILNSISMANKCWVYRLEVISGQ
jgi:hypothetical protein